MIRRSPALDGRAVAAMGGRAWPGLWECGQRCLTCTSSSSASTARSGFQPMHDARTLPNQVRFQSPEGLASELCSESRGNWTLGLQSLDELCHQRNGCPATKLPQLSSSRSRCRDVKSTPGSVFARSLDTVSYEATHADRLEIARQHETQKGWRY
eukprot:571031-Rhodomonas_salina.3